MISDEDIRKAFDRVARTPDGVLIYQHLQKVLMGVPSGEILSTLPISHGRRTLARDLMAMMMAGIEEAGIAPGTGTAADHPVTFAVGAAADVRPRFRGGSRRVLPDEPGPGDA